MPAFSPSRNCGHVLFGTVRLLPLACSGTLQVWPGVSAALRVATPSSEVPRTERGRGLGGAPKRSCVVQGRFCSSGLG